MTDGDCFDAAYRALKELIGAGADNPTIVHGLPLGQGPIEGVRHWHAWAEGTVAGERVVLDLSNGRRLQLPADVYRAIGNVVHAWEFTHEQACKEMVSRGHWGPWLDEFEDLIGLLHPDDTSEYANA